MKTDAAAGQDVRGRRISSAWYALAILLVINTFNYADRYLLAGLSEPLKAEFGLSDRFLGLLMGPAFALLYTVFSVPIARLADRSSRVLILSIGCFIWSLFTIFSGMATSGWMLAAMRVGVGIGEAAFVAPAYSILADRFLPERRGLAFAVLGLGIYLGQAGGYVVGPAISAASDWRMAFITVGLAGICFAMLAWLTVAEPVRRQLVTPQVDRLPLFATLVRLWRHRAFCYMNLGMSLGIFSGFAFGMWAPSLFVRSFEIPLQQATSAFGLAFGAAGLTGMLLFGVISDRFAARDLRWPLRLATGAVLSATCAIALSSISSSIQMATLLAIPSGLLGGGWSIGALASLQNILPDRVRATATALFTLTTTFIGMVFGPLLVGVLSDIFGGVEGLRAAVLMAVAMGIPAAFLLWRASVAMMTDGPIPEEDFVKGR